MTTPNLARIERVDDLHKAWPHEAQDFTPWLAKNIDQLGEALGMNLEFRRREAPVGSFSLDILAVDPDSDRPVIIENQLETTNHTHLGQLLTYAAGHDASVIVWLTKEFRDEHRQALDWLNQRTGEDTQFFGVVVELWKIGDSLPAPHFKLVATPNEWGKSRKSSNPPVNLSGKFRQSLRDACDARGIKYSGRPGGNWSWLNFEYPIKNVRYGAIWHGGKPGLEMIIERPGDDGHVWNQTAFEALERYRPEINKCLVESDQEYEPVWEPVQEPQKRSRIYICRNGDVYKDTESWDEFQSWLIRKLHKFQEVFTPRLQKLIQEEQHTID
jgi:hypothetical protein